MRKVRKGCVLEELAPYLVEPAYSSGAQHLLTDAASCSRNCDVDIDPTFDPNLKDLPRWTPCPIWNRIHSNQLLGNPDIRKIIRKSRRKLLSSSDATTASWRILCILSLLRIVEDNVCGQKNTPIDSDSHTKQVREYNSHHEPMDGNAQFQSQPWWVALVSKEYMNDTNFATNDEDDDDIEALLVEIWPHIQEHIPWEACHRLYLRIRDRLHVLTIPHPLTRWAQKTVFELTEKEFEESWNILKMKDNLERVQNRLHASKLWLDQAANIPERFVGILVENPLVIMHQPQSKVPLEVRRTQSALALPRAFQSCLPNTYLDISVSSESDIGGNFVYKCKWIALYDLNDHSEVETRTLSTMPRVVNCECLQCSHQKRTKRPGCDDIIKRNMIDVTSSNLAQAQRLAHSYFHQEAFDNAVSIYRQCHEYCTSARKKAGKEIAKFHEETDWLSYSEADLWHTIGGVFLAQRRFALAQIHWKRGDHYQVYHKELHNQLQKQVAYQYFTPELQCSSVKLQYKTIQLTERKAKPTGRKDQFVFVASDVIDADMCQSVVDWGVEYASHNGGWTTSRHYSVPTTDLPVHQVPKLLDWFQRWMSETLFPLLRNQFGIDSGNRRFYVHDAFLVRYEATASNRFLPLHFDESTHSCVLALNDDFDGGGSYIYDLKQSVTPSKGGMVSFMGNRCLHGGDPVTRGVRYILAIFLYLDEDICSEPLERINCTKFERNSIELVKNENQFSKRLKKGNSNGVPDNERNEAFSFSFF